jgi:predicted Zn-dependent protease
LGVQYSRKIGYAPGRVIPLFTTFLRMEKSGTGPSLPNFLPTHPLTTRRIEEINKMLEPGDAGLKVARPDYLKRVDGMVYGENPRQGYSDAGIFYHPDLQFMVKIPQGWKYQNSPKQFIMAPQDEKAAVFLTAETNAKELPAYLQGKLSSFSESQVNEISRNAIRINGLNAYRGVFDIRPKVQEGQEPSSAPMTVDIHCIRKGSHIFTFMGTSLTSDFRGYESVIETAIRSFSPLTDPDRLNRRPLRVSLQAVRSGETLQAAVQRLNAPQKQWKALEMMNGMSLSQAFDANRTIKFLR